MDLNPIRSAVPPLQQVLAEAPPAVQLLLTAVVLLAVLGSTWFWAVTLDRLFERFGARRVRRSALHPDGLGGARWEAGRPS